MGSAHPSAAETLLKEKWLDPDQRVLAARELSNLGRSRVAAFDRLERHGYETARWNELLFMHQDEVQEQQLSR